MKKKIEPIPLVSAEKMKWIESLIANTGEVRGREGEGGRERRREGGRERERGRGERGGEGV